MESSSSHPGPDENNNELRQSSAISVNSSGTNNSQSIRSMRSASGGNNPSQSQRGGTLSFFQSLMGRRSTDYHGDTAAASMSRHSHNNNRSYHHQNLARTAAAAHATTAAADLGSHYNGEEGEGGGHPSTSSSCWESWWRRITIPAHVRHEKYKAILESRVWRATMWLFTLTLLFGAAVRDLFFTRAADQVFDGIFLSVIGFFTVDMAMRIDVEPKYFVFPAACLRRHPEDEDALDNPSGGGNNATTSHKDNRCANLQIGSFIFWCELMATLALLFEVSLINDKEFGIQTIGIKLDRFGAPKQGMQDVNEASPVEYRELHLLITIAKSARVARFIRSSTAVEISSKINWYNLVDLYWWCQCCLRRPQKDDDSVMMNTDDVPSSLHHQNSPWGVHSRAREEERLERRRSPFLSFLRKVGLLSDRNEDARRHIAAVKIQRAWKRCLARRLLDDEGYETGGEHSLSEFKGRSSISSVKGGRSQLNGSAVLPRDSSGRAPPRRIGGDTPAVTNKKGKESQVGSAMREITGQRVAIGILVALVMTVLFTYTENDATRPSTMIVLHNQTANPLYANRSLQAARSSSVPDLYLYQFANGETIRYDVSGEDTYGLRDRETLRITVEDFLGEITIGWFAMQNELQQEAVVEILSTIFIILVWFVGVTGFAGPVMILVVIPIERMVKLLEMLMRDPLGYQNSARYRRFVADENEITKNTRWTKEVLKGMETSFLMHTILRIGSLMKVGFGSAGVEIIRNNLEGRNKSMLTLSGKGSTVSCIFLFCDIRQFTDATECLQEEVFVFTNKIAAVVHSICNSYGGSANKNIGDAFLLSWTLDDQVQEDRGPFRSNSPGFTAKNNQADKALLSVVRINMALYYDEYYLEAMADSARDALLAKLSKRRGPVVQLGFGLTAGKAVQGSIGSQRKIDATYVSEAVERAEFLESSTKKYGVKLLMSDDFYRLLHPNQRRRCRKIDQILIKNDDDDDEDEFSGDQMELYTFDMDIDALWKKTVQSASNRAKAEMESESGDSTENKHSKRDLRPASSRQLMMRRRTSHQHKDFLIDESSEIGIKPLGGAGGVPQTSQADEVGMPEKLVLPTGPALYNAKVWVDRNMHEIRRIYTDGIFLQKYNAGLQAFYAKDWERAKQCFTTCIENIDDGPSKYFLEQIEKYGGQPPRNFAPYGIA